MNINYYICPWALPNEEIPLSVRWDEDFDYDLINIKYPDELVLIESINLSNFTINESSIDIQRSEINYCIDKNTIFPKYFGLVFTYKSIKIENLKKQIPIQIKFLKKENVIEEKTVFARVFRPILLYLNGPINEIVLTDEGSQYSVGINLVAKGFGFLNSYLELEMNQAELTINESAIERALMSFKTFFIDTENLEDIAFKSKFLVSKESIHSFIQGMEDIIHHKEEREYKNLEIIFENPNISPIIKFNFILKLLNEINIQFMNQNVFLTNPKITIPKDKLNQFITNLILKVNYKDLMGNIYDPVKITIPIKDLRKKSTSEIVFDISIDKIKDDMFLNIEKEFE